MLALDGGAPAPRRPAARTTRHGLPSPIASARIRVAQPA